MTKYLFAKHIKHIRIRILISQQSCLMLHLFCYLTRVSRSSTLLYISEIFFLGDASILCTILGENHNDDPSSSGSTDFVIIPSSNYSKDLA